jgi:hypothetical protein
LGLKIVEKKTKRCIKVVKMTLKKGSIVCLLLFKKNVTLAADQSDGSNSCLLMFATDV